MICERNVIVYKANNNSFILKIYPPEKNILSDRSDGSFI